MSILRGTGARPGETGAARVARLGSRAVLRELAAESAADEPGVELVELLDYELGVDGQAMRSPMRFGATDGRDALAELHGHPEVRRLVDELAGQPMLPSKASYLYFGAGTDFIGLHTDVPACELVVLVGIDGDAPSLVVYPELRGRPADELLRLAERTRGAPPGGSGFVVEPGELVALVGQTTPHQTPPEPRARRGVVASLCYIGEGSPF